MPITKMQRGSVGGSVSEIPLGSGFESQVPQNALFDFSLDIPMQFSKDGLSCSSKIHLPDSLQGKSNDPD